MVLDSLVQEGLSGNAAENMEGSIHTVIRHIIADFNNSLRAKKLCNKDQLFRMLKPKLVYFYSVDNLGSHVANSPRLYNPIDDDQVDLILTVTMDEDDDDNRNLLRKWFNPNPSSGGGLEYSKPISFTWDELKGDV